VVQVVVTHTVTPHINEAQRGERRMTQANDVLPLLILGNAEVQGRDADYSGRAQAPWANPKRCHVDQNKAGKLCLPATSPTREKRLHVPSLW